MKSVIPIIFGLMVIIVGTIIIWKLIQCMNRLFPDPAPPVPDPPIVQSNTIFGAYFDFGPAAPSASSHTAADGFAADPPPCDCGCALSMSFVSTNGAPVIVDSHLSKMVDADQFNAELIAMNLPENNAANISYAGGVMEVDGGGVLCIIERSSNLRDWEPVLTNNVPPGRIVNATVPGPCSGAFFRVRE